MDIWESLFETLRFIADSIVANEIAEQSKSSAKKIIDFSNRSELGDEDLIGFISQNYVLIKKEFLPIAEEVLNQKKYKKDIEALKVQLEKFGTQLLANSQAKYRQLLHNEFQTTDARLRRRKRGSPSSTRVLVFGQEFPKVKSKININGVCASIVSSKKEFDECWLKIEGKDANSEAYKSQIIGLFCTLRWKLFVLLKAISFEQNDKHPKHSKILEDLTSSYLALFEVPKQSARDPAVCTVQFNEVLELENCTDEVWLHAILAILRSLIIDLYRHDIVYEEIMLEEISRLGAPKSTSVKSKIETSKPTHVIELYFRDEAGAYVDLLKAIEYNTFDFVTSHSVSLQPNRVAFARIHARNKNVHSGADIKKMIRALETNKFWQKHLLLRPIVKVL